MDIEEADCKMAAAPEDPPDRAPDLFRQVGPADNRADARLFLHVFYDFQFPMLIVDTKDARIVEVNQAACTFYGYTAGQLIGMSMTRINTLPEAETHRWGRRFAGKGHTQVRFRHRLASGEIRDVEVNCSPIHMDGRVFNCVLVVDTTETQKLRRAQSQTEAKLKLAIRQTGQIVFDYQMEARQMTWHGSIEELTGYLPEEINRIEWKHWQRLIHPQDVSMISELLETAVIQGGRIQAEFRLKKKNGAHVHVAGLGAGIVDGAAGKARLLGVIRNIEEQKNVEFELNRYREQLETLVAQRTQSLADANVQLGGELEQRKKTQKALQQSNERYRSIFENAGAPAVIVDKDLNIVMANTEFKRFTGFPRSKGGEEARLLDFIDAPDRDTIRQVLSNGGGENQSEQQPRSGELECRLLDGGAMPLDVSVKMGHLPGTRQHIVSFMDITHRKKAEQILRQKEADLREENRRLKSSIRQRCRFGDIIGKSEPMQRVYELILQAAATDAGVIVYGESGTGKELVARAMHGASERRDNPLVAVHCGAIPENLIESEFFGYTKGAFTGAVTDKPGYLDRAGRGTLFLDEIGEIGLNMQVKMLRVMDGYGYSPVGSGVVKKPDLRFIAATNRDLEDLIRKGRMREDFFYRIHILPIRLPPLRHRKEDIPLLVSHFLNRFQGAGKKVAALPAPVMDAMMRHNWPGNVRELQNAVQRYLALDVFEVLDESQDAFSLNLPTVGKTADSPVADPGQGLKDAMAAYEKQLIQRTLARAGGNRSRAARCLGVERRTLQRKIKAMGIG